MTELDKFKRRTIRSVARLLRQKKPPDELWSEMKKETGTDCRVLWERMRALCIKKLNRMLAVDDRSDTLPSIARLSLTDWLLVDLVLVHEKIDVIAMDKVDNKAEQKPLVQLFNLVQRFDVEGRTGEPLAEAWAAATVFYNRQGRQCSPMLLQRRWYQLKKLTRCRFYKFWQSYRGNNRLLAEAKGTMPTRLQMAVAKRYPAVITGAFPEWDELIELKLVILPEEFESKMRVTDLPKPSNSTDPDLVVVEPFIETIELGEDSDTEGPKGNETEDTTDLIEDSTDQNEDNADLTEDTEDSGKSNDATTETDPPIDQQPTQINEMLGVKVKSEPMDEDGLSNVQVVATTHVTELEIPEGRAELNEAFTNQAVNESETLAEENRAYDDVEYDDDDICADSSKQYEETSSQPENSETNADNTKNDSPGSEDDVIEIPPIVPAIDLEPPSAPIMPIISSVSSTVKTQDIVDTVVDNIIKVKADEYCRKDTKEVPGVSEASNIVDNLIKDKVETFLKTPKEDIMFEEKKVDVSTVNLKSDILDLTAIDLMADLNFNDDGLEFIDDGVEFIEEMDEPKREPVIEASPDHESSKGSEDTNKFDLKLLMDPVVYTTKLDHMNIFTEKQLGSVYNKEDIAEIIAESKPVSKKSFDINIKQEDTTSQIDDTNTIDDVGVNDDLFTNQESDDEDKEEITVSLNSYMLKKPRSRTYNPIQLCKNPDFNTKLRRLAFGFFSSPRNREFLNACIPMTIDVSKAFESKLVNGTLYLKSTGANSNVSNSVVVKESVIDNQSSTSVLPSALPMQSLLDNSKTNILNLIPIPTIDSTPAQRIESIPTPPTDLTSIPTINVIPSPTITTNVNPVVTERQKIINLPDIDKVRKINRQLLTAQVPPIRVYAGDSYRPPAQPIRAATNQVEQIKPPEALRIAPAETVSSPIPPALSQETCLPTVVKVKSEAAQDNKELLTAPESIPSEPLPPAKQKLLKIINQAKLSTQEALTKIDGGCKTLVTDDLKQLTLVRKPKPKANTSTYKKPINNRVSVPWTPRFAPRPESIDDFLITGDTLNKMLHLMSGNEGEKDCSCCSLKQRKAEWNKTNRAKKKKETNKSAKDSSKQAQEKKTENEGTGDLNISDKDSNNPPVNTSEKQKVVLAKGRFVRYCCWANQKVCNRKRMTKHTCPPDACVCCCREALAKLLEDKKKLGPIEVSDDEDNSLKTACESIENVVQQSRESTENFSQPDQKSSKPKLVIMRTIATATESNNLETCPADNSVSLHPALVNEPVSPKVSPSVTTKIVVQPNELSALFTKKTPGPKPKLCPTMPNFVPTPKEPLYVPCLSQKPTNTPAPQLSIVIDGSRSSNLDPSKKCHVHPPTLTRIAPKEKESKVLYLHSKSIAKSPTESPIFLGKNKILLTTVKFPRKDDPPPLPTCEVFQAPKIIPTLPLPNGVQLVLLPSGNVTYTIDAGVKLTEEQLATLPTIIAAVKEQLDSSSVLSHAPMGIGNNTNVTSGGQLVMNTPPPELIAHNQTEDLSATSTVNLETNEVFQDEELPQKIIRTEKTDHIDNTAVAISPAPVNTEDVDGAKAVNTDLNPLTSEAKNITSTSLNDNVDTHSDSQLVATSDTRTEVGPVAESNSRNESKPVSEPVLLTETQSVAESLARADIQNPGTETIVQSDALDESNDKDNANNRKTLLSDLMEMSGISAEDATAAEPLTTEQGLQEQVPVFINPEQEQSLPELTPVTSFAELKYACEQDGKFFKLDFETGVIIPINVCIKKNAKPKAPAHVKAVIDLTDDIEDSNDSTSTQDAESLPDNNSFAQKFQQYVFKGKTVTVPNTIIKPIKLFKAVRPPSLLNRLIKINSKLDSTTPVIKRMHQKPRKQTFKKVEAVLDLVDSDTPMEEEYLMDSSDNESSKTETESMLVEALEESDYSSDDEPLAKKSKRMKESHEETDKDVLVETNIRDAINDAVSENLDPIPNPEGGSEVPKYMDVPMESENTSDGNKEALNINVAQAKVGPENEPEAESEMQSDLAPELDPEQDPDVDPEQDPDVDPELRFMSGPSDNEGEEDCILGV